MVLRDWSFEGMLGSMFLHDGIYYLIWTMMALWVFGNAINTVIGNILYIPVYLFLGLCASASHLMFSNTPATGATGAVHGIVGMVLVLFPMNKFEYSFYSESQEGKFEVRSYIVISGWFILDFIRVVSWGQGITYAAHLGGFVSGIAMATILLAYNKIATYDLTIFDIISGHGKEEEQKTYLSPQTADYKDKVIEKVKAVRADTLLENDTFEYDPFTDTYTEKGKTESPFEQPPSSFVPELEPEPEVLRQVTAIPVAEKPVERLQVPVVSLRLLRVLRESQQCTCFFVNEGEALENISIESTDSIHAEIYPNKTLKNKEPGWIKLGYVEGNVPQQLSFILTCRGGSEEIIRSRLTVEEETKKIIQE
jgi:membrane associated rhomboid family serine protease